VNETSRASDHWLRWMLTICQFGPARRRSVAPFRFEAAIGQPGRELSVEQCGEAVLRGGHP